MKPMAAPASGDALLKQGHGVDEHRVARLMRQHGIRAKTVKKWSLITAELVTLRGAPKQILVCMARPFEYHDT